MTIKIFTYPANTRAFKSQIAAKYAGVEIEVPAFNFETDRQTAEFKANFPLGKVPAMLTAEGKPLYESNAMARYVARLGGDIYGSDAYTQAINDQWIDYSSNEIDPINMGWLYSILGYTDYIAKETQKAKENTKKALAFLDSQLVAKPFLTGFRIALADIVVACSLYNFYKLLLEPSFRAPYVNVNRWFNTCINQPNFKAVVGEFTFCEKMMVYVPPKKEVKEEKPKAAPAPKKEEAAEEEEAEKPKKKNPLDDLPPSTFVLDEFKRVYSNNEVSMSVPWFFEHFDAAGFSVFHCEYKFNDELGPLFKTCNLVGGWFQRLETLHKYAFASIIIGGEEVAGSNPKDQSITGIWVFRGAEIPHDMNDCDDSLVYNWKKLDVVADKDLITKYLTWEVPKFLQGKLYK